MKKLILAFGLFLLLSTPAFARTCTWDGGGGDNLASTAANWDTDTTCVAADAVVFDGTSSKNCTFDLTASFASINTTGYGGVVTASATITTTGGVTFANSTFAHGSQTFLLDGTQTVNQGTTGNGFYNLSIKGVTTITLSNNITVANTLDFYFANSNGCTLNGAYKIMLSGNLTFSDTNTNRNIIQGGTLTAIEFTGTAAQVITGASSWDYTPLIGVPVIINKSSNGVSSTTYFGISNDITFTAGNFDFSTSHFWISYTTSKTITYTAGTLTATSSTFRMFGGGGSTTFSSGFLTALGTVGALEFRGTGTLTLGGDLITSGSVDFLYGNTDGIIINGAYNLKIAGGITFSDSGTYPNFPRGTSTVVMNGTGTINGGNYGFGLNLTINTAGTITFANAVFKFGGSGYTPTLTYTAGTVSTGTSTLSIVGTTTLNTNGINWYDLSVGNSATITLSSDLTATGTITQRANEHATFTGNYNVNIKGHLTQLGNQAYILKHTGTGVGFIFNGTSAQTWTGQSSYANSSFIDGNITINKASGTLTLVGFLTYKPSTASRSFIHTLGTVAAGTSTFVIDAGQDKTIDAAGISFYNVLVMSGTTTTTLTTDLNVTNLITQDTNSHAYFTGSSKNINVSGGLTQNTSEGYLFRVIGGKVVFNGTGTWTGGTSNMVADVDINTAGTLTLSGTIHYGYSGTPTLRYVTGTVNAGTSVFKVRGAATLDTNGMSFYDVGMDASITLGSNLTLTHNWTKTAGTLSGAYAVIFNGTSTASGATAFYSLTVNSGKTLNLTAAQTFSTNASGTFTAISATISSTTGTDAILNVNGSQAVALTTATDIDSSGGSTVHNYLGTNTGTINWDTAAAATPVTTAYAWVG